MPRYPIKAFRALLADGGQDKIYLTGGDSTKGYRIAKFQLMNEEPFQYDNSEHVVKIYKTLQASIDGDVNFNDDNLIGVAIINNSTSGYQSPSIPVIIFDKEVINQDIYITHNDGQGNQACNYYLELEEVTMSDAEAANVNFVAALTHT